MIASAGWLDQAPVVQGARDLSRVTLQEGCTIPGTRRPTGASEPTGDDPLSCAAPNEIALIAGGSPTIPGSLIRLAPSFFPVAGSDALILSRGLRFDPDGTPRPFSPATDLYNFAADNYLQIGLRRFSANLLASFEISPAVIPYIEASWVQTRSPQQLAPVPALLGTGSGTVPQFRINLDNPFLTAEARRILDLSFGVDAQGDRGVHRIAGRRIPGQPGL